MSANCTLLGSVVFLVYVLLDEIFEIPIFFASNVVFHFAVDIISAIEFDKSGDHLATGDRGGRVVLFERTDTKDVRSFLTLLVFSFCIQT